MMKTKALQTESGTMCKKYIVTLEKRSGFK